MSNVTSSGTPEIELPNVHVADAACQFRETAELLLHQLPRHNSVLPVLMVGAFAIELYLKSLNSRNVYHNLVSELGIAGYRITAEPIQKGHSLAQLFDGLAPRIRAALQSVYATHAAEQPATIREALCRYDGIFIEARYPFENGTFSGNASVNGLVRLAGVIGDYVCSLNPLLQPNVSRNRASQGTIRDGE